MSEETERASKYEGQVSRHIEKRLKTYKGSDILAFGDSVLKEMVDKRARIAIMAFDAGLRSMARCGWGRDGEMRMPYPGSRGAVFE